MKGIDQRRRNAAPLATTLALMIGGALAGGAVWGCGNGDLPPGEPDMADEMAPGEAAPAEGWIPGAPPQAGGPDVGTPPEVSAHDYVLTMDAVERWAKATDNIREADVGGGDPRMAMVFPDRVREHIEEADISLDEYATVTQVLLSTFALVQARAQGMPEEMIPPQMRESATEQQIQFVEQHRDEIAALIRRVQDGSP